MKKFHTTKGGGKYLLAMKNKMYLAKRQVKRESLKGLSPVLQLKNQLGNSDYSNFVKADN
ncbi:hypothetical protein VP01_3545g3 [Puccinia sorghi]|uniref:Uncharacterized protein n=1 Tax=Puccinia sorghi TaxID=27349 RepID=A0A0L6UVK6_9BASI|nr:hypothetical protein VP01_3545g3 [Puccinia sorghi]